MRTITYAIHPDGLVYSRFRENMNCRGIAIPVLLYDKLGKDDDGNDTGDFTAPFEYELQVFPVRSLLPTMSVLRWTKKIPIPLKNRHREFWGLPPLKVKG